MKTLIWKDTAALFTIAKIWKQAKYPSRDDWIKKTWFIYTTEYKKGIKKNEITPFATTLMDLENIMLTEIRKKKLYDIYIWNL